jgi:hypothetical protein
MTDQLIKTKYPTDELNEAITEQGIVKAFEQYKNNAGAANMTSFSNLWRPLVQRMIEGYKNNMGVAIAEEKYKRNNPFWDPRD